jgi:hypothetical protein
MGVSVAFVRRLLLCVIVAATLAACGNASSQQTPSASPVVAPAATTATPALAPAGVPQSLAFSAPRVGGGTVDLSDYAGKPVLLWFWAPT